MVLWPVLDVTQINKYLKLGLRAALTVAVTMNCFFFLNEKLTKREVSSYLIHPFFQPSLTDLLASLSSTTCVPPFNLIDKP